MATRAPRGSARSRSGQADADRGEFSNDDPLEVILPSVPPDRARPAGKGGSQRRTAGSRSPGSGGGSGRGGSGSGGRGSGTGASRSGRSAGAGPARSGSARGARSGKTGSGRTGTARRRNASRPSHDPVVILAKWLFRTVAAGWMLIAGTVGFAVRRIGRSARDLHPDHQRDGVGLFCLGLAIVFAAGVWVRMGNTAGQLIYDMTSGFLGEGAFLVPVLLALLGWRFMRHPDRNSETSRAAIGWAALLIGLIGLIHVAKGTPHPSAGAPAIRTAGGLIGYAVSAPLVSVLTPWVATPLLGLVVCFGVLVITGTPVRQVPARLRELRTVFGYPADEAEDDAEYEAGPGGRKARGEIGRSIRLRPPAIEAGDHVKPYDTPVLDAAGRRGSLRRGSGTICSRTSDSPRRLTHRRPARTPAQAPRPLPPRPPAAPRPGAWIPPRSSPGSS